MPAPVANEGVLFTHALSKDEFDDVKPYAVMLDALLAGMVDLTKENLRRANAATRQYDSAMRAHFGKPLLAFETDPELAKDQSQPIA